MNETNPFNKANKVFETDYSYIVEDGFPVSKGHVLIVPKANVSRIDELSSLEFEDIFSTLRKYVRTLEHNQCYNVGINCGEYAGQTVKQLHIHLIPRYENDVENPRGGVRGVIPNKKDYVEIT